MLLLHPVPTSADAGCDLCTLCPALCTLHPDLWILCLWCFPSFNWCKHSTCTGGGCHQLQLALVVLFHSATSADSLLAHMVASPSATCAGGAFSSIHWRKYCTCARATCTVWWWYIYIYIYIYIIRFRPRVQNGQDGRPLHSRRVRLKYSPRITSNKKEIVRNEADTSTSPSGKDTGINRRYHRALATFIVH